LVAELGGLENKPVFAAAGALTALAAAYKRGDRTRLRVLAGRVFEAIRPCFRDGECRDRRPLKQLAVKLVARVGVAVLKPRVASWCYARGKRTLMVSDSDSGIRMYNGTAEDNEANVGLEEDGSEAVLELVVDTLLEGMRDSETRTRWSGAKGIGRIASRLPRSIADDVVESVLFVFSDPGSFDDDRAWHGSCLALAELSRLGVLLPVRLSDAFSALSAALEYDRRRGSHSVGAHVRDSACYVAWAFARAYAPQIVAPHLPVLVEKILMAAVFDREVHVRRAAGAALQENIGRQGVAAFGAKGIKLTQIADFFVLGSRERAYIEVAPAVAHLGYWESLFVHLLEERIKHWDASVRLLAAKSLGVLVEGLETQDRKQKVMLKAILFLAPLASESRELASRHGALLALSHITRALDVVDDKHLAAELGNVVPRLEAARLYRGRGGELVRSAACGLIEALTSRPCPLPVKIQLRLLDALDESSSHAVENVRLSAVEGVRALTLNYFGGTQNNGKVKTRPSERLLARTVWRYIELVREPATANVSRGACRCLGALPRRLLAADNPTLDAVLATLSSRARREDIIAGAKDAETRRDAIAALNDVVVTIGVAHLTRPRVLQLQTTFVLNACRDFGIDKRGDVGSWSRIKGFDAGVKLAAVLNVRRNKNDAGSESRIVPALGERAFKFMTLGSLKSLVIARPYLNVDSTPKWTALESEQLCCSLLKHLGEKLDSVRNTTLGLLPAFIQQVPAVPRRKDIEVALLSGGVNIDLPVRLCTCLALGGVYHDAALSGLVISAGSTNSKASARCKEALIQYATAATKIQGQPDTVRLAKALILQVRALLGITLEKPSTEERNRSYLPLLKSLVALLDADAFTPLFVNSPEPKQNIFADEQTISEVISLDRCSPGDQDVFGCHLVAALTALAAAPKYAKDIRKICATADALLAALNATAATVPSAANLALVALLQCLQVPYPRARAHIAEQLYARLVELSIASECFLDRDSIAAAQELLSNASWDAEGCANVLSETVFQIADVLEIERGHFLPKETTSTSNRPKDELETYASLVKDAGY
jgi:hypothetical protein